MSKNSSYNEFMAGRPAKGIATDYGQHLASLRKAAGLSQMAMAEALGIPQRTLSFYEQKGIYLPSNLLKPMAELLGTTIEVILNINAGKEGKRGPKSKLERQFGEIQKLSRTKQEFVSKLLGQILAAESA